MGGNESPHGPRPQGACSLYAVVCARLTRYLILLGESGAQWWGEIRKRTGLVRLDATCGVCVDAPPDIPPPVLTQA